MEVSDITASCVYPVKCPKDVPKIVNWIIIPHLDKAAVNEVFQPTYNDQDIPMRSKPWSLAHGYV